MARLVAGDGGIAGRGGAPVPEPRVDPRMLLVAIVRVHRVAGAASRGAIVAGLLVGAEEPQVRVVEARLGDVDDRHRDEASGRRPAIGLAKVGAPRLVELLQRAGGIWQAHLGKLA